MLNLSFRRYDDILTNMRVVSESGKPKMRDFDTPPLFYDILSGEFSPPNDPQHMTHTLGRLSVRAYDAGERVEPPETGLVLPRFIARPRSYQYTPTWAGTVRVTTVTDDFAWGPLLKGIVLENQVNTLAFFNDRDAERCQGLRIQTAGDISFTRLELGPGLNAIKATVSDIAQNFFDSAAQHATA